ncbi:MAG: hypothetical protein P4L84_37555 [Isosphaeraceae bacterium]|nr:hypothetical protein [Isosphaeraceae bacterium]
MSRSTEIVVGAKGRHFDPPRAVAKLFEMVGADEAYWVIRTAKESHEFDVACDYHRGVIDDPDEENGYEGTNIRAEVVPSLYLEGTTLKMNVLSCPASKRIKAAIRAGIDAVLLGEFSINSVYLTVGGHDVFQVAFVDEPVMFGRYFASITFGANGLPEDAEAVLEQVLALDEFQKI